MQRPTICVQSCSRALPSARPSRPANVARLASAVPSIATGAHWVPRCCASLPGSASATCSLPPAEASVGRAARAVVVGCTLAGPKVCPTAVAAMPQLNVPTYCMVLGYADSAAAVPCASVSIGSAPLRIPRSSLSSTLLLFFPCFSGTTAPAQPQFIARCIPHSVRLGLNLSLRPRQNPGAPAPNGLCRPVRSIPRSTRVCASTSTIAASAP